MTPTLLWFRRDLRLQDNPALMEAIARGGAIVPVFIQEAAGEDQWSEGAASSWWRHRALARLDEALRARGSRLVLARGDAASVLRELIEATGAEAVYWNRRYEPAQVATDRAVKAGLRAAGVEVQSFNSALLFEPQSIANKQGKPFQVFTPYWRHCLALPIAEPVRCAATALPAPASWPRSLALDELGLQPTIPWDGGLRENWEPGEGGAMARLKAFVREGIEGYAEDRNRPDHAGTSRLSPWLHHGEIGPRQIWSAVKAIGRESGVFPPHNGARVFLSEIGWREFAYHLLFHFPRTPEQPLREEFARFPWAEDRGGTKLAAWQRGRTGYPIVDAGLRELWHTGWMHNRVRMIVASFLVKHQRLPWQRGAKWFWDTLVDADLASNTLGWQWSAGCGADAAPYFRIFAPVLQGRKFDPAGDYVRRWVPELARIPVEHIHAPWEAPPAILARAGVTLGENYPRPIVDHAQARAEALAAFKELRRGNGPA
ncbi:DNA photolyase family protein [Horticoccus luteus]|uniref:Deoxyribodipyrimidine photo-lyase n=1 Tax=Horticoccus luteus TaxID=2862869 RepID=A0A8F9XHX0_9BACT|nr:deoxyribodipyrimidine photo-lyase [Horticoccus luteus]QYM80707.1 DNA photolyase family protein [Horticoccus luteus]